MVFKRISVSSDPLHPAWIFARCWFYLLLVTLALWLTASDFDETEIAAEAIIMVSLLLFEGAMYVLFKHLQAKEQQ